MTKNEKLKQSRIKKGLTQAELAALLNVKQAYISGLETSQTFGIKKAQQMAKILDVDANWLYNDDNGIDDLSQNSNISSNATIEDTYANNTKQGFNDTKWVNSKLTYAKNSTFPERVKGEVVDLNKWVDPNHVPIPVFDNTYGVDAISQLLKNDSYKPSVILLKGHLGCHAVVRHIDSAMNKHFPVRCQLGIERLYSFKKRIEPGKPYMVVLEELTVTRYVYPTDTHFILRSSDVELYPDMQVDKEEILEMWRVRSLTPIPDQQLF